MSTRVMVLVLAVLVGFGALACGDDDDAVSYSGDIGITLNLGSSDLDGTTLADRKNITTESGNPCAKFVRDAENRLGRAAGSIRLDAVRLAIGDNPRDVTNLSDLWSGDVAVSFVFDDNTELAVASLAAPASPGPTSLQVTATQAQLDARLADLLACNYAVKASGTAADGLSNNFDAALVVTLRLSALK
jgi:hypothetical protein